MSFYYLTAQLTLKPDLPSLAKSFVFMGLNVHQELNLRDLDEQGYTLIVDPAINDALSLSSDYDELRYSIGKYGLIILGKTGIDVSFLIDGQHFSITSNGPDSLNLSQRLTSPINETSHYPQGGQRDKVAERANAEMLASFKAINGSKKPRRQETLADKEDRVIKSRSTEAIIAFTKNNPDADFDKLYAAVYATKNIDAIDRMEAIEEERQQNNKKGDHYEQIIPAY